MTPRRQYYDSGVSHTLHSHTLHQKRSLISHEQFLVLQRILNHCPKSQQFCNLTPSLHLGCGRELPLLEIVALKPQEDSCSFLGQMMVPRKGAERGFGWRCLGTCPQARVLWPLCWPEAESGFLLHVGIMDVFLSSAMFKLCSILENTGDWDNEIFLN